jgi:hypothetical protein
MTKDTAFDAATAPDKVIEKYVAPYEKIYKQSEHSRTNFKTVYGAKYPDLEVEYTRSDLCVPVSEVQRLREALEFYADDKDYYGGEFAPILEDKGAIARNALEGTK